MHFIYYYEGRGEGQDNLTDGRLRIEIWNRKFGFGNLLYSIDQEPANHLGFLEDF